MLEIFYSNFHIAFDSNNFDEFNPFFNYGSYLKKFSYYSLSVSGCGHVVILLGEDHKSFTFMCSGRKLNFFLVWICCCIHQHLNMWKLLVKAGSYIHFFCAHTNMGDSEFLWICLSLLTGSRGSMGWGSAAREVKLRDTCALNGAHKIVSKRCHHFKPWTSKQIY